MPLPSQWTARGCLALARAARKAGNTREEARWMCRAQGIAEVYLRLMYGRRAAPVTTGRA